MRTQTSRFQGDPAVNIDDGGAKIYFRGGQPEMDHGLHNAVLISLFTKPGWWGNVLESEESKKIGSTVEEPRTIIDIQTLNDYEDAINLALQWMIDVNLASRIDITVTNPYLNQIQAEINIHPPGQDIETFIFLKYGTNWIEQAFNPVHKRF